MIAVLAKINPVAGAGMNPVLVNTRANTRDVRQIALLHPDQRRRHFGRACASSRSNHLANGALPVALIYSRTSIISAV